MTEAHDSPLDASATAADTPLPGPSVPDRPAADLPEGAGPPDGREGATSVLDDLLARLSSIDDVPLDDRPALFEQANEVLVAALADLEEV